MRVQNGAAVAAVESNNVSSESAVDSTLMQDLMRGVGTWAHELHLVLCQDSQETVCCSPASIVPVLGLIALGMPEGDALEQVKEKLGLKGCPTEDFHQAMQGYCQTLASTSEELILTTANGVATVPDCLREGYLSKALEIYQSENFDIKPGSVEEVNAWVSEKTKTLIPKLLDSLDGVAVLLNALYFKGIWENEFNPKCTRAMAFTSMDGSITDVEMMHKYGKDVSYFEGEDFKLIELPFKGECEGGAALSFVAALPHREDGLSALEDKLTPDCLAMARNYAYEQSMDRLCLPKMDIEYSQEQLFEVLTDMGFPVDILLTEMGDGLYVDRIVHKTKLKVDEKGAEGAAATGAVIKETCIREPIVFQADRPFVCFIMAGDQCLFQASVRDAASLVKADEQ